MLGIACGPRYPLILHGALVTAPRTYGATIANAKISNWTHD